MSRFVTVDRETAYLLAPSVNEWLPANHLARFVVEVIEQKKCSPFKSTTAVRHCAGHIAFPRQIALRCTNAWATACTTSQELSLFNVEEFTGRQTSKLTSKARTF